MRLKDRPGECLERVTQRQRRRDPRIAARQTLFRVGSRASCTLMKSRRLDCVDVAASVTTREARTTVTWHASGMSEDG
jgi:hypothetical protein